MDLWLACRTGTFQGTSAPETMVKISPEQLEAELLQLPPHVRARLAEVLISSLDEDGEIEAAWLEEAGRRYEELRSGTVRGVPAADVLANARARLRQADE